MFSLQTCTMALSQQATTASSARLTTSEEGFELAISLRSALDTSPTNTCWTTNFPYVKTTDPPESCAHLIEAWNNIFWDTLALAPRATKLRVTFQKKRCIKEKCSNWSWSDKGYTLKTEQKHHKAAISSSHLCVICPAITYTDTSVFLVHKLYTAVLFLFKREKSI